MKWIKDGKRNVEMKIERKGKKNGEDGEIVVLCIEVNVRLKGNDDERVPFFNRSCKFGCLPLWFRAN